MSDAVSDESTTDDQPKVQRMEPPIGDESQPFWDATREQVLRLPWCTDCERAIFYPRSFCPTCLGSAIEWRDASGRGTVYAVTVESRPQNPGMAAMAPYAVALVDLEEGVRMLTNIVGTPADEVTIGQPVTMAWEPLSDGRHLPVFVPA